MSAEPDLVVLLAGACERMLTEVLEALETAGHPRLGASQAFMLRLAGGDGSTISRMAEIARMTPQAVSKVVDQLVALGLAERSPDPSDGRVRRVRQTRAGRQVARTVDEAIAQLEQEWRDEVGDRRLATMRTCLEAFVAGGQPPPTRTSRAMRIRMT